MIEQDEKKQYMNYPRFKKNLKPAYNRLYFNSNPVTIASVTKIDRKKW